MYFCLYFRCLLYVLLPHLFSAAVRTAFLNTIDLSSTVHCVLSFSSFLNSWFVYSLYVLRNWYILACHYLYLSLPCLQILLVCDWTLFLLLSLISVKICVYTTWTLRFFEFLSSNTKVNFSSTFWYYIIICISYYWVIYKNYKSLLLILSSLLILSCLGLLKKN